jgi:hypothetical protein
MKITKKISITKKDICERCKFNKTCASLPGFCALISYVPIAIVVIMLAYFLITMKL